MTNEEIAQRVLEDLAMDDATRKHIAALITLQLGYAEQRAREQASEEAIAIGEKLIQDLIASATEIDEPEYTELQHAYCWHIQTYIDAIRAA